jgi:NAD(P)-dependent dehydrogenase (short-subunit alcohol dehydrogenase family)
MYAMRFKQAIITGAAGNLGRAVTNSFLDAGYEVHAIISHSENTGFISRTGLSVYQADLISETEALSVLKGILNKTENIDFVIMTVGGYAHGSLQEVTEAELEKMIRLNFFTAFNVTKSVLPGIEKQKTPGRLVFIGARPGLHAEDGINMVSYTLSKSLIFRLSEIINKAYKNKNIRSFVVVPGTIDTPQNRAAMPDADFTKWVKPEEIARQILNLERYPGNELKENILEIYGES